MVLCCYKAVVGDGVYAWLVLTTVPYLWKTEGSGSEGGGGGGRGEEGREEKRRERSRSGSGGREGM